MMVSIRGPQYDQVVFGRIEIQGRIGRIGYEIRPFKKIYEYELIEDTTFCLYTRSYLYEVVYEVVYTRSYKLVYGIRIPYRYDLVCTNTTSYTNSY